LFFSIFVLNPNETISFKKILPAFKGLNLHTNSVRLIEISQKTKNEVLRYLRFLAKWWMWMVF